MSTLCHTWHMQVVCQTWTHSGHSRLTAVGSGSSSHVFELLQLHVSERSACPHPSDGELCFGIMSPDCIARQASWLCLRKPRPLRLPQDVSSASGVQAGCLSRNHAERRGGPGNDLRAAEKSTEHDCGEYRLFSTLPIWRITIRHRVPSSTRPYG